MLFKYYVIKNKTGLDTEGKRINNMQSGFRQFVEDLLEPVKVENMRLPCFVSRVSVRTCVCVWEPLSLFRLEQKQQ